MSKKDNNNVLDFKIVLVGSEDSKKTAIADRLQFQIFEEDYQPTIGAGYIPYRTIYDEHEIELQIWDTAGMERYKNLGSIYYRDARSCIIVYSQKKVQSPDHIQEWLNSINSTVKNPCYIIVVANEDDIKPSEIHDEEIIRWCNENHLERFVVSSKTGAGINEMFQKVIAECYKLHEQYYSKVKIKSDKEPEKPQKKGFLSFFHKTKDKESRSKSDSKSKSIEKNDLDKNDKTENKVKTSPKNDEARVVQKEDSGVQTENSKVNSEVQTENLKEDSGVQTDKFKEDQFCQSLPIQNDKNSLNKNFFIGEDDEKYHKIIKKLGEGSTSIAYKVIDKRNGQVMCKKIIKIDKDTTFKSLQNAYKEFEILQFINHPCICKSIGINTQEQYGDENVTTISIFLEYLDFSLKECFENDYLMNTMKVKIAVEVAFGMAHIHKLGLIHRDLKMSNIMLNGNFDSKIIDFELVHVTDIFNENKSLTKGIGTLAYMSPEMQNEDDYDNKTDVYSYGVLLHVLFSGNLPHQKMQDKLNKLPCQLPKPSYSISFICIELIRKCLSPEPLSRPSFVEIIKYLENNNFSLADDVDFNLIQNRYQTLKQIADFE